jgi:VanZ family protein
MSLKAEGKIQDGWMQRLRLSNSRIPRFVIVVLFVVTLAATLTAGLWPFRSPQNEVTWVKGEDAIEFGVHGTAFSTGELGMAKAHAGAATIEIWIQPAQVWTTGTIFASYDPTKKRQLMLTQDYPDLVLQLEDGEHHEPLYTKELRVDGIFRKTDIFLTIVSDGRIVSVYVDGHLMPTSSKLSFSSEDLAGQIILANSAVRDRSWNGTMKGLAIYGSALNAETILQHYEDWTAGKPTYGSSQDLRALYLFRERAGRLIRNSVVSGVDLEIPERFRLIDQIRFESPISESRAGGNYLKNSLLNVVGFVPLGFAGALLLAILWNAKRGVIAATLIGAATSLAIEYFQSYLPTRYSGLTDIVTNTIGTWLGVSLYQAVAKISGVNQPPPGDPQST